MPRSLGDTNLKIAITGVAGFVGCNLTERLLREGHAVAGLDDLSHGSLDNLAGVRSHPELSFSEGSILDPEALERLVAGADVLVHLAARKIPRYSDALDTLLVNGEGGLNVLRACQGGGVRRMVLASTSDCYGRNPELPFSEESTSVIGSPLVRRWSYAVSKMYEEQMLFAFRERFGLEAVALRLFGGYGPRQNLTWWGGPQSVFIGAALKGEPLEIHGTGQQTRSFTFVDDMVEGFVRAIVTPEADGEMINVGSDREISIVDLARMIWSMLRDDEPLLERVPLERFGRYEDVERRLPDRTLCNRVLGYAPAVTLEQGLPKTIEWQRTVMRQAGLL